MKRDKVRAPKTWDADPRQRSLSANAILMAANDVLAFRLVELLKLKGVLSAAEAAQVFVSAAEDMRAGTEDDEGHTADAGEGFARMFEERAAKLLRTS